MERHKHLQVQNDIVAALAEVGKKHGLVFESAGGTYGTSQDVFKIRSTEVDASGQKRDVQREDYIKHGAIYGLKPEWLDKTFVSQGAEYTVTGFRSVSRSKFKVATRRFDGSQFYFTIRLVIEKFAPAASKPAA